MISSRHEITIIHPPTIEPDAIGTTAMKLYQLISLERSINRTIKQNFCQRNKYFLLLAIKFT